MVTVKVYKGLTFGKTAKTVSPTSPREVELTPERCTDSRNNFASSKNNLVSREGSLYTKKTTHIAIGFYPKPSSAPKRWEPNMHG